MKTRLPLGLILIAALQFVAPLIVPPDTLKGISPAAWITIVAVFVVLGISLLRRKSWSRVATIFIQGFNIIIRILVIIPSAIQGNTPGNPLNVMILSTFAISMLLSSLILYYIDLPDVQMLMQ